MSKAILRGFFRFNQQLLPFAIAALSSAISTVLTVRLCQELRGDDGALISPAIGICFEAAKYTFAIAGIALLIGRGARLVSRLGGLLLCSLSLVLVGTSIAASLGYLLELDGERQAVGLQASRQYREASAELALLDRQLAVLVKSASADTEASYRTRALGTLDRVDALRERRVEVSAALAGLEANPARARAESSYFTNLAAFVGVSAARLRLAAYGLIALLLEVVSVAAYLLARAYSRNWFTPSPTSGLTKGVHDGDVLERVQTPVLERVRVAEAPVERVRPGVLKRVRRVPAPKEYGVEAERGDTGTERFKARYEKAKTLVTSGRVQPSVRALRRELQPLGQQTAMRYLSALVEEGVLRREGRRFVLSC